MRYSKKKMQLAVVQIHAKLDLSSCLDFRILEYWPWFLRL